MRITSSSLSEDKGTTGPKISSWAMVAPDFTSAITAASSKKARLGRDAAAGYMGAATTGLIKTG